LQTIGAKARELSAHVARAGAQASSLLKGLDAHASGLKEMSSAAGEAERNSAAGVEAELAQEALSLEKGHAAQERALGSLGELMSEAESALAGHGLALRANLNAKPLAAEEEAADQEPLPAPPAAMPSAAEASARRSEEELLAAFRGGCGTSLRGSSREGTARAPSPPASAATRGRPSYTGLAGPPSLPAPPAGGRLSLSGRPGSAGPGPEPAKPAARAPARGSRSPPARLGVTSPGWARWASGKIVERAGRSEEKQGGAAHREVHYGGA